MTASRFERLIRREESQPGRLTTRDSTSIFNIAGAQTLCIDSSTASRDAGLTGAEVLTRVLVLLCALIVRQGRIEVTLHPSMQDRREWLVLMDARLPTAGGPGTAAAGIGIGRCCEIPRCARGVVRRGHVMGCGPLLGVLGEAGHRDAQIRWRARLTHVHLDWVQVVVWRRAEPRLPGEGARHIAGGCARDGARGGPR